MCMCVSERKMERGCVMHQFIHMFLPALLFLTHTHTHIDVYVCTCVYSRETD